MEPCFTMKLKYIIFASLFLVFTRVLHAELDLSCIVADGMVLQRESKAPIWGWAEPGTQVTATFQGQTHTSTSGADGKWIIAFEGLEASSDSATLEVSAGEEKAVISDVVVGDVWINSGQSNMAYTVSKTTPEEELAKISAPNIRTFKAEGRSHKLQEKTDGKWLKADTPGNAGKVSAVAFHFANRIQDELDIPIGLINITSSATAIQAFMPKEIIKKENALEAHAKSVARYEEFLASNTYKNYVTSLETYKVDIEKWDKHGKTGERPTQPKKLQMPRVPYLGNVYNARIYPLRDYGVKGIIWYQGEHNSIRFEIYSELLKDMVLNWREILGAEVPFYYVQVTPIWAQRLESAHTWVFGRNEMRIAQDIIPKSGMACIHDLAIKGDVHPTDKETVGIRLSHWAMHFDYGKEDVVYSGPLFRSVEYKDGAAIITFEHAEGLTTRDGKAPTWFELAAENGEWVEAEAKIVGEQVVVSSPEVPNPAKVRHAWDGWAPEVNLVNNADLITSSFSTHPDEAPILRLDRYKPPKVKKKKKD